MRGTRDMHAGLAQLAVERNDLGAAAEHLRDADELGEDAGLPKNPGRWRVALASLRQAEGDLDSALDLLAAAERVYVGDFAPNVQPIRAMRARLMAADGDVSGALAYARQEGLAPEEELSYLREYEHVTLARILLARHTSDRDPRTLADARGLLGDSWPRPTRAAGTARSSRSWRCSPWHVGPQARTPKRSSCWNVR